MELLDNGFLAAAVTDISPGRNGGGPPHDVYMEDNDSSFELSEYFLADEDALPPHAQPELSAAAFTVHSSEQSLFQLALTKDKISDTLPILPRMEEGSRIAFRTQTDVENLDDGYKWRKYGKKSVKNSRNPRNYYRCSTDGCLVKKRVQRDHEDPSYVVTTYEGIHNHTSPGIVYYAKQDSVSGRFHISGSLVHEAGSYDGARVFAEPERTGTSVFGRCRQQDMVYLKKGNKFARLACFR